MTTTPASPSDEGPEVEGPEVEGAETIAETPDETTAETTAETTVQADQGQEVVSLTPFAWRLLGVLVGSVTIGVAAGLIWHALADLPVYRVGPDGGAATTERGLAAVFGVDAIYSAIGAVVGIAIGLVGWRLFGHRGWRVTLIVAGAAVVAALVCWGVGVAQGPNDFAGRIAAAGNGDEVPIDFALHTRAAIYVWPLFATGAVMFASAFGRERDHGW